MNILIVSHAAWRHTGYGALTRLLTTELPKHGHKVFVLAVEERGPCAMKYRGVDHFMPVPGDPYGEGLAEVLARVTGSKAIISVIDPWVLSKPFEFRGIDWYAWCAIDQTPVQAGLLDRVSAAKKVVALSEWGADKLRTAGLQNVVNIHGGVDLEVFAPNTGDRESFRAGIRSNLLKSAEGAPIFVAGMVASNLPGDRKALRENIAGFADFAKDHANAALILWTTPRGGVDLDSYINQFPKASKRISIVNAFETSFGGDADIARFYNGLDVLLHASAAEGFGLPIVESMACGVPVIAARNSSMPELVPERVGWLVDRGRPEWSRLSGWWDRPEPIGIAQALDLAHAELAPPSPDRAMLFDCQGWAKQFDKALIGEQWAEALQ